MIRNVVGYDPDQFIHMGFADATSSDPHDDRRFRSHLSMIVTRLVNKIITLPVLKDHGSAGVTLALKNMSHGMNNNVARSHLTHLHQGGSCHRRPGPCDESEPVQHFIPTAVNQRSTARKGDAAHPRWPDRHL